MDGTFVTPNAQWYDVRKENAWDLVMDGTFVTPVLSSLVSDRIMLGNL